MPLRCLIDSMVFDAIAAEPAVGTEVDRLTRAGRLELLAAAETMLEIGATPELQRRRALQRVRVLVVPPAAAGALLDGLLASPGVSDEDARIAAAAAERAVPLVTEDRALRTAVMAVAPALTLWAWEADLRPRLLDLAREHPPVRRGR